MGTHLGTHPTQMGITQIIDSFHIDSRILTIMFRDRASILMEAKAKREPISTISVVGFGHVTVEQDIKKITA